MSQLKDEFLALHDQTARKLVEAHTPEERERIRVQVLGRKGSLAALFERLSSAEQVERAETGKVANHIRESLYAMFDLDESAHTITDEQFTKGLSWHTNENQTQGFAHPLRLFLAKVESVFHSLGYDVLDSPELEDEQHNFDFLNIPKDHPVRDEWDTFFVRSAKGGDTLLRTHTSPMQIRSMKRRKPPARIIIPGRVFRHEATDASHSATFYQCEGFCIDKGITLTDLMGTLHALLTSLFGEKIELRFRPHYYTFVEPGMDVDMKFVAKGKNSRWLEMLGSGMIHPKVLENMGIDPDTHSGFAFGLGIDRLAMLWYGMTDIRDFYAPKPGFMRQF